MEIGKLTVKARANTGKGISRQLRAQGFVPGVCYGVGLDEAIKVVIDPKALKASLDPHKRTNTVINVELDGAGKTITAMIWDYQVHPIRRDVVHVDLKSIDPEKSLETDVPVELIGKSPGVVNGGQLNVARHEITVQGKPVDIPVQFELDISELDVGGVLHVSDLSLPPG
ncbi:MAG: 50S ribosomal protein L25, partial [Deltaproteobacteria bacterium]|nr:50S ribosomal protein L25 [Deltaproteobacteria bacterium]